MTTTTKVIQGLPLKAGIPATVPNVAIAAKPRRCPPMTPYAFIRSALALWRKSVKHTTNVVRNNCKARDKHFSVEAFSSSPGLGFSLRKLFTMVLVITATKIETAAEIADHVCALTSLI